MHKQILAIILMMLCVNTVSADLYLELAAEAGGQKLIDSNTVDSITAGGGIKFAIGFQNPVNEKTKTSIRFSVGYLSDSIFADNGQADFNTVTLDAMVIKKAGAHSFGFGATMHMLPEYSDYVIGYRPEKIEYDDALGFVFQYGYQFVPGLNLGLRYTDITYQVSGFRQDAGSLGIFVSSGF
ncbi:MAG: hypothetical protein GY744_01415 [Gammaproteobacteria bacterium]|nr:hypothetical protein [Gammaproteobacteria bacterium]